MKLYRALRDNRFCTGLLLTVFTALVTRTIFLQKMAFDSDEALSVNFVTKHSFAELLFSLPLADPHPPLYYIILKIWSGVFGTSILSLRSLSVLLGVSSVAVIFILGAELAGVRSGTVAGLLVSVSPWHVEFAQSARMYTLFALGTALSLLCLFRFLDSVGVADLPGDRVVRTTTPQVWALCWSGAVALTCYAHVYGLFAVAAEVIGALAWMSMETRRRTAWRTWAKSVVAAGVLLLPWLLVLLARLLTPRADSDALSWASPPGVVDLAYTIYKLTGVPIDPDTSIITLFLLTSWGVLLSGVVLAATWRGRAGTVRSLLHADSMLLALVAGFTVFVPWVVSVTVRPIFMWRYTLPAAIAIPLLLGLGVSRLEHTTLARIFSVILVLGVALGLPGYYSSEPVGWGDAVSAVEREADPGALIIVTDHYMQHEVAYHQSRGLPVRAVPDETIRDLGTVPTYPILHRENVSSAVAKHSEVYVLISHASHSDSLLAEMNSTHEVEYRERYGPVNLVKLTSRTNLSNRQHHNRAPSTPGERVNPFRLPYTT